jgi:class 3 adenylate cyclase/tetratricopeptide (TPR) repeat protein
MKCSRCQHENPSTLKFCGECGARLAAVCASCGAANAPDQKFCGECGTKLWADTARTTFPSPDSYTPRHLADKILTSRSALEGERKQVTVLFADLKGSMELLADRDPEEARKILDPVIERMMEAVHRYEGTVNQVMGDGIMALFGAPLAHEDHAVRACYAALRMQEAISRYADELQRSGAMPVYMRVGINSGEVVVRSIGSDLHMDYTAVGQTTHLASRMEQLAKPGSTLLTDDTLQLAEGYVQVKPLGVVPVKGLTEPIKVFELTGASHARTRLQAAALRGLTRFVGRKREIEVLNEALANAAQSKGQVVAILGEPGVGKSRLFWEFTHSHRTEGWLIVEASSVSYGKATPYLPVIDLLKGYFKIADNDDARAIREKVTGKLLTLDRALEPLLPPLLALLDQPVAEDQWQRLDPPQRRRQTLDALKRLWLREAQAQPLVLVFEDLHWIDTETQEFLNGMMDSVPAARLLLLFNYRPEYQHPWGSRTYYIQLRLDALSHESARELLQGLLGPDHSVEPLKNVLIDRTEGNPFFLEESVRTLVEIQALNGDRGAYRLAKPLDDIQVPATVQAMLAARIDRLRAEDKRLLQTAAVIGKDVPYTLLQAIADLPETQLRESLSSLQAAEFLYEATLFPDLEFTFKHALTHDVAYGGLLQGRRHELHARIVGAIERLHKDRLSEQAERLAHHAQHAELWEKALRYLRQAADKAGSRWAFRESARYLEQALDVVKRLPEIPDIAEQEIAIRLDLRNALIPRADYQRIAEILSNAVALAEQIGDNRKLALALVYLAHCYIELFNVPQAMESGHRALALAEKIDDLVLIVSAQNYLLSINYTLGNYEQAISDGFAVARASDEVVAEGLAQGILPLIPWFLPQSCAEVGRFDEALSVGEFLMHRAEGAEHPFATAGMYIAMGFVRIRRGDAGQAIALLERTMKIVRTYALDNWFPWTASSLGLAYALAGRHSEGVESAQEAVRRGNELRLTRFQPLRVTLLANSYLLAGRYEDALAATGDALELARRYHERGPEAWALYLVAASKAKLSRSEGDAINDNYLAALKSADELGMRPLVAHCHFGLAKFYRQTKKGEQARQHFTTAITLYREMAMQFWLEKAEVEMRELG